LQQWEFGYDAVTLCLLKRILDSSEEGDAARRQVSLFVAHSDERQPWRASPTDARQLGQTRRGSACFALAKLQLRRPQSHARADASPSEVRLRSFLVKRSTYKSQSSRRGARSNSQFTTGRRAAIPNGIWPARPRPIKTSLVDRPPSPLLVLDQI